VSDLVPFVVIVGAIGAFGVVLGILVAPLIGRFAEGDEGETESDGDGTDEPA
jgi:hypothetical protein